MTRFNPFPKVGDYRGSPMGRSDTTQPLGMFGTKKLSAQHQGGSDGYDRGGAYWGNPANVWAVWAHGKGLYTVKYVRAETRQDAINKAMNK